MAEMDQAGAEGKARKSARTFVIILAVVFAVIPLFLLIRDSRVLKVIDRVIWERVPCQVLSAGVARTGTDPWYPYEPVVKYRYVLSGTAVESESVGEGHFALYDEADVVARRMQQGGNYCYVGGKPRQSVLFRFSGAHRMDLLFAGGYLGLGILLFASQFLIRTIEGLRVLRAIGLGFLFLLAGGTGLQMSFMMVKGIWQTSRAMKWPQIPCTIMLSALQADRSDNKMIYRPDILYRYEANGRSFVSSRVDFFQEGAASPQRELIETYPEGTGAMCYVNPRDAAESVLTPEWSKRHVGFAAMGLFIAGLAGGVLWFWFWPRKIKADPFTPAATESVLRSAPQRAFVWFLFFGVLFVLVNFVIVSQFFGQSLRPGLKWIPWAALFGMNGFLISAAWPTLKPLMLPKAILRLARNHLARNSTTAIAWEVPRNTKSFELSLICVEWRSKTEAFNEIYNEKIFTGTHPEEKGAGSITLPETASQSVLEKDHVVEWAFKVRLNARTWRSMENLYVVHVT